VDWVLEYTIKLRALSGSFLIQVKDLRANGAYVFPFAYTIAREGA